MSIPSVLSVRHKSVCESQNLLCEMKMSREHTYETPENPLADAIEAIVGERPPIETAFAYRWNDLSEADKHWLQDWCSERARPEWATGLSMIEAAELIVEQACENANIARK